MNTADDWSDIRLPRNTIIQEGRLYSLNSSPGWRLRGQPVIKLGDSEYRSWSPFTSKLAACIMLGTDLSGIGRARSILYLGASYGTTVSHLADVVPEATIYCIEVAREPFTALQIVASYHRGIIPMLEDAAHPERYATVVSSPDLIIEDVAQKNMLEILVRNLTVFGSVKSFNLAVKARSIDSAAKPDDVYRKTMLKLHSSVKCETELTDLSAFEKDHAMISGRLS